MSNIGFRPDFSLSALQDQINAISTLYGGLVKLDNDGQQTICVYDAGVPVWTVVLRTGPATAGTGGTTITGKVYVANQLQQVTAYRG